ncbi:universal stress protein [Endozoicomonas gorgoniicola]|uniref:Universal stress protein n=1 Tax=Endozoicomonas gorgoniicola TaxID=1234144 RepID=A0ABT3MVH4_9GAMM|nr:universal stress protein [Endozoicomonas gorgoniicola]MCW7553093.1 universal stress protein [Endozoicomonas gorgoniicola]
MRGVAKVLVVIDTRKEKQIALNRAIEIARATESELHVLSANPKPSEASREKLEALSSEIRDQGVKVFTQEKWSNSLVDTVIHARQMERCHLVVKDYKPEGGLLSAFSTPNDWNLLRQCRVPVLLVRHDRSYQSSHMLAAVNGDPDDTHHHQLNQAILQNARLTADVYGATLHLATAHPTTMLAIQDHGDGATDKDRYLKHCQEYAHNYGIRPKDIHVRPGPAESLIPELGRELQADLLIVGTQARTGLPAVALGNTAEQLISDIDTDLLVVQPRHHMIPLERELER